MGLGFKLVQGTGYRSMVAFLSCRAQRLQYRGVGFRVQACFVHVGLDLGCRIGHQLLGSLVRVSFLVVWCVLDRFGSAICSRVGHSATGGAELQSRTLGF